MSSIWTAGDSVYMIELGGFVREEAKLAKGATIDAIGKRRHHLLAALSGRFWLQQRAT